MLSTGNEWRGDDGVGPAVIEQLRLSHPLPPVVELMDCGMHDLSTVLMRQDISRLVIVDAADMHLEPGQWRRLDFSQPGFEILDSAASNQMHGFGLSQTLSLGRALDTLPREIVIFAVQPQVVGYRQGLSEPVNRTVTEVCEAIHNELELTPKGITCSQFEISPRSDLTETRV